MFKTSLDLLGGNDHVEVRFVDRACRGSTMVQVLGISGQEQSERSRLPRSNSRSFARSLPVKRDEYSADKLSCARSERRMLYPGYGYDGVRIACARGSCSNTIAEATSLCLTEESEK